MSIGEIIKALYEAKYAIARTIISKGGELDPGDGYTKFADAIYKLPGDREHIFTGNADDEKLKASNLNWTDDDVEFFEAYGVTWDKEFNWQYELSAKEMVPRFGDKTLRFISKSHAEADDLESFNGFMNLIGCPKIKLPDRITDLTGFFEDCVSLTCLQPMDTSKKTVLDGMFRRCKSLLRAPAIDASSATTLKSVFYDCSSLEFVELSNVDKITNTTMMFSGCLRLREAPNVTWPALTDATSMFESCDSLRYIPDMKCEKLIVGTAMFSGCKNLKQAPVMNQAGEGIGNRLENADRMFAGCSSLRSVPYFNTTRTETMASIFYGCSALTDLPEDFQTPKVVDMSNAFSGCSSLRTIKALKADKWRNVNGMLNNCDKLTDCEGFIDLGNGYDSMKGEEYADYCLDVSQCPNLTLKSLVNIINGLGTLEYYHVAKQYCYFTKEQMELLKSDSDAQRAMENAEQRGWGLAIQR